MPIGQLVYSAIWFRPCVVLALTCCPSPPADSRYCGAVLKLLQGYVIQGAVLSLQVGFSSSSCCDEQRFENPILLLENPPSNIRKTLHPLDMWTYINSSKTMKASQRREAWSQANATDCLPTALQKRFTQCFCVQKELFNWTPGVWGFFLVGLLPVLKWDPGVIPRPELSGIKESVQLS